MSNFDNKKPVTHEMMQLYIQVLEKQVQQMTLVVTTLQELNDKLEKVEGHFHNGFKSEIKDHITSQISDMIEKISEISTTIALIQQNVEQATISDKELGENAFSLNNEIKEKIGSLRSDVAELKTSIKIDRATNLIGLGTFVLGLVTIILKMFGRI